MVYNQLISANPLSRDILPLLCWRCIAVTLDQLFWDSKRPE